ncbi:MAG: anti-sigma factor [Gammaproteobacteria bacterium]
MTQEGGATERLLDLIIKRTLEGLDLDEAREFATLAHAHPDVSVEEIEQTVAALDAVTLGEDPPLPDSIAAGVADRLSPNSPAPPSPPPPPPSKLPWLAAAAALVFGAVGWWQALSPSTSVIRSAATPPPALTTVTAPSDRERLDADAAALSIAWAPSAEDTGRNVRGAVHWSHVHQVGYMELGGLAVNDPSVEQYQLWIFDATRSQEHPVDGGVFDISGSERQRIPIHATRHVRDATLFAVTVEIPGGVMVSDRQRIVALAQVPAE